MKRYRAKCCDILHDFKDEKAICPSCTNNIISQTEGRLVIYRKAMYMSCNQKFEVFLNGEPFGDLVCKQEVTYCLPYGVYTLHFKCGETIKCKDITIELTPEKSEIYVLTRVKMKFWKNVIVIEECDKEDFTDL